MKPTRMQTNMRGTLSVLRSAAYSFSLRGTFEVIELQYPGYQRFFSDTSSAVGRSHEPDRNRAKKSLWHPGSRVRIPYKPEFFLAFFRSCEKLCQKCDDLLSYNSADFVKSLKKTFEANVSAARPWVRCLTHGAFHVPYTTCIPEIGVVISQSFRG